MLSRPTSGRSGLSGRKLPLQLGFGRFHDVHSVHYVHSIHSVHLAFRLNRLTPQITD
jgi:hypothetical protein